MTRTDAELFDTITRWQNYNRQHQRTTVASGDRPEIKNGPLRALYATHDLVESLQAGRWEMITAARLAGANWAEIARAMDHDGGADALRAEYAGLVDWYTTHPSITVDVTRWRAALGSC